jgi:hypothetical protein
MTNELSPADSYYKKLKSIGIGFLVWTVIGLSFGTRGYLNSVREGVNDSFLKEATDYLIDFYIWALVSPVLFWIARQWPIERGKLATRIPFHILLSLVGTYAVTAITIPPYWYLGNPNLTLSPTLGATFARFMTHAGLLHQGLLVWWGTMATAHAIQYYRRYRPAGSRRQSCRHSLHRHSSRL